MACSVICQGSALDLFDDGKTFLATDLGTKLTSDLGVGASVWSRQDGESNMLTLARCSKQDHGDTVLYGLEFSVVISEACTEMSGSAVEVIAAAPGTAVDNGCTEYGDFHPGAPIDP
jgi:hypothetical protein